MKNQPLVTAVMTTINGSKTIQRAIDSINKQTYKNIEIIIYDDCSTDDTVNVIKKNKGIRLIKGKTHFNGAVGRNVAAAAGSGKYIAFLDDDDEWLKHKIELQVKYLEDNPYLDLVFCDFFYDNSKRNILKKAYASDYRRATLDMSVQTAAGSNLLVSRKAYEEVKGFDEKFAGHQDLELVLSLLRKYKAGYINKPLSIIHGSSRRAIKNAKHLEGVKILFLNKFKPDIQSYGKKISDRMYARQLLQIARNFAQEGNIKKCVYYYNKSLSKSIVFSPRLKIFPHESYFAIPLYLLINVIFKK